MGRITIISLFYNQQDFVDAFFSSFERVYGGLPCRLIVGDNNSDDQTVQHLRVWKERYPALELVFFPDNYGFARSNNLLSELADTELILFLNPDVSFEKPFIAECAALCQEKAGIVAPLLSDTVSGHFANYAPFYDSLFFSFWKLYYKFLPFRQLHKVHWVQGAALFVSRELFLKAGRFDEGYWLYTEDMAFCRSCRKLGFPAYIVRDYMLYHKKTLISDTQFDLITQNLSHYFTSRWHSLPYLFYLLLAELANFSPTGRAKKLIKRLFWQ